MPYEQKTLDPIVVNAAKKLHVDPVVIKDVAPISEETTKKLFNNPVLVVSGIVVGEDCRAILGKELEDGLYLFTFGNSYCFIPVTQATLSAQLPIRVPCVLIDTENEGAGVVGVVAIKKDATTKDYYIVGATSSQLSLPFGWGFSLFKIT